MAEILERPQQPTRHRLDVEAYYKMVEAGILESAARVELIDGEIIDMPAIGSPHACVTNRLDRLGAGAAADGLVFVSVQNPLRLDAFNEPEPDLLLLKPRADDYRAGHPSAADVLLLVEVSDSSLAHVRGIKLPLYARFDVPEVWIVDILGAAVEQFRLPAGDTFAQTERSTGGTLSAARVPAVTIEIAALLA